MCKNCMGYGLVSAIATWLFFVLLLNLLGSAKAGINALWLTLLIFIAMSSCPIMNPRIAACCQVKPKRKK